MPLAGLQDVSFIGKKCSRSELEGFLPQQKRPERFQVEAYACYSFRELPELPARF
jgi:hypothetical protein